jgi:hypothetical protein
MSFVDAKNQRGEIQTVPEHYLTDFPDQFESVDSEESTAPESQDPPAENPDTPTPTPSTSAKAAKAKES